MMSSMSLKILKQTRADLNEKKPYLFCRMQGVIAHSLLLGDHVKFNR